VNRRDFVGRLALGAAVAVSASGRTIARAAEINMKPNILFLFTDDHSWEALSLFGGGVRTPNLDRLAEGGVVFTHAYNQGGWHGAICVASRTMLNTGRFLWHARALEPVLDQERDAGRLWPQCLAAAGYETYFTGKWHVRIDPETLFHHVSHVRPGMPRDSKQCYHRPVEGEPDPWNPWDEELGGYWDGGKHWSEVLADDAAGFLRRAEKSDKPFFMYLSFNAPHDPRQSPKEYVDRYPVENVTVPANFMPEYPWKDAIGCGGDLRDEALAPFPRTQYAVKVHRREYFAIIAHMDAQIGRILDALEESGKADNTIVIFSADQGLAVGHHGLMGKQSMFEHSMRSPLFIAGPGFPKNRRITTPVYLQDVMPTTLELAGAEVPGHVEFRSLLPLIEGKRGKNYDAIYGAYIDLQRMVRKNNWKLIYYPKIAKTLLFDLSEDPEETTDLAGNTEYASLVQGLREDLKKLQAETGDELTVG